MAKDNGTLVVVGVGLQAHEHLTVESKDAISQADAVLYMVADPFAEALIKELAPTARNLYSFYVNTDSRATIYSNIASAVVRQVKAGSNVCMVAYGHPGVGVDATREAINTLKNEGYSARMLPSISSDACLYADLGIDPFPTGMQSYEATYFLSHKPQIDLRTGLVLWQIGCIGNSGWPACVNHSALAALTKYLLELYGTDHPAVIYQAANFSLDRYSKTDLKISALSNQEIPVVATLYVPPKLMAVFNHAQELEHE